MSCWRYSRTLRPNAVWVLLHLREMDVWALHQLLASQSAPWSNTSRLGRWSRLICFLRVALPSMWWPHRYTRFSSRIVWREVRCVPSHVPKHQTTKHQSLLHKGSQVWPREQASLECQWLLFYDTSTLSWANMSTPSRWSWLLLPCCIRYYQFWCRDGLYSIDA